MPRIGIGLGLGLFQGGSAFDTDYQAVLNYATTQGYTLPSAGQRIKQNQLIVDLKAAGVWNKLDTFAVFATDGSSSYALIDWKRLSQYTAVNSPTFTINQGFNSNGTSSYIDTNYNASTNGINFQNTDACEGAWVINPISGLLFGTSGGPGDGVNMANTIGQRLNMFASNITVSADLSGGDGLRAINRTSAINVVLFNQSTTINRIATVASRIDGSRRVLNAQNSFLNSASKCSIYFNGANLVSEQTNLNNSLSTYVNSL
jgi:hypothetical protein